MRITVDGSFAVAVAGRLVSEISASSPSSVPGPAIDLAGLLRSACPAETIPPG